MLLTLCPVNEIKQRAFFSFSPSHPSPVWRPDGRELVTRLGTETGGLAVGSAVGR